MAASSHAAFLGPGLLSLDDMPLATGPRRAANRPAPRPAKAAPAQPVTREVVAQPEAAVPITSPSPASPGSRQRRPLARFVHDEDSPIFYISLSDLMCLLLVFFVLIFSLGQSTAPGANAAAPAPVRVVYRAAMPVAETLPVTPAPDPFAQEEASPASTRLGLVSVAQAGTTDPGLPALLVAELTDDPAPKNRAGAIDRDLLALLSASDSLPAQAAPWRRPTGPSSWAGCARLLTNRAAWWWSAAATRWC